MKFPHTVTNNVMAIIPSKNSATEAAKEAALRSQPNNSSIWRTTFVQNFPFKTIIQYRDVTVGIIINVIINTVIKCFNTVAVCQ